MSHHKLWALGITSILLLSTASHAFADDNTEVRAGKVRIIRDADGNTQIETDRVKVQTNSVELQRSNPYRNSPGERLRQRTRRTTRPSVVTTPTNSIDSCLDRDTSIQRTNNSSSSTNTQINRIRGNNRTVIQSTTDR